jgi:hypothetical protein
MSEVIIEGSLNIKIVKNAVNIICEALGISVPNLHIFTDQTIKHTGACYQNSDDEYMIVLKEDRELGQILVTLAHEMVHVKQYMVDNLAEAWDATIPYMERWWEKEAYAREQELALILIQAAKDGKI